MTSIHTPSLPRFGALAAVLIIAAIAILYWPIHSAEFVWDDRIYLHDVARLRSSDWLRQAFGGIFDSADYFRPLCMLLFTGETKLFHASPGPAHLISIILLVANIVVLGALTRRTSRSLVPLPPPLAIAAAMLVFAAHPLLIEPVAWISGQFELVATFFMLLGLLANLSLLASTPRAFAVASCFFLAACAKESAVSFPLLLLVFDWTVRRTPDATRPSRFSGLLRQQWRVYALVASAGFLYLLLRTWGLGHVTQPVPHTAIELPARLQLIAYTYVTYWHQMVWPMTGIGPVHIIPYEAFAAFRPDLMFTDVLALAVVGFGAQQMRRRTALGALIVGVTVALLPVLHIVPIESDESFYHDRYAMTALSIACVFAPAVLLNWLPERPRLRMLIITPVAAAWLMLAIVNVRTAVPLWSNEVALFRWILNDHPGLQSAQLNLLAQYLARGDLADAEPIAASLERSGTQCTNCMLSVANYAIASNDAQRAAAALRTAREATRHWTPTRVQIVGFILTTGDLAALRGDLAAAEQAYRDAAQIDSQIAGPRLDLAYLLLRQGRLAEADEAAHDAFALLAPEEQTGERARFERALAERAGSEFGAAKETRR